MPLSSNYRRGQGDRTSGKHLTKWATMAARFAITRGGRVDLGSHLQYGVCGVTNASLCVVIICLVLSFNENHDVTALFFTTLSKAVQLHQLLSRNFCEQCSHT